MKKKVVILGRGTAGAINAAITVNNFVRTHNIDCEIDWIYDPSTPTQAVGEGTTLDVAEAMFNSLDFLHTDMPKIDANYKTGIFKSGWGKKNNEFVHHFFPPQAAFHINAVKFQNFVFEKLKQYPQVRTIEKRVASNEIDADFIFDCSGKPNITPDKFIIADYIPVNSVYVTQCFWEYPRFTYSLTNAAKHGWYFGIPLQNRCAIGYLYNNQISTLEEVKEDVQHVFERYQLTPSNTTNAFSFSNYFRKNVFEENIVYSGNSSFFLEPLEATTLSSVVNLARKTMAVWIHGEDKSFHNNAFFNDFMVGISNVIMLHYLAGSSHENKFWNYATNKAETFIQNSLNNNLYFRKLVEFCIANPWKLEEAIFLPEQFRKDFGTWPTRSFRSNITELGIADKLKSML